MIGWWVGVAHATAWVLPADHPRALRRAARAARGATITRMVTYDERTSCVEVAQPQLRIRNRVARRLHAQVETRVDCDWGWFPEGTGWVAFLLRPPSPGLLPALEQLAWPYYDLRAPSEGLVRVCVAEAVVGDPAGFTSLFDVEGVELHGVRRVGACHR